MKKQPKPKKNKNPHVVDEVVKELLARKRAGRRKYGVYLQPDNGRDALQDLMEELLDGVCYLKQYLMERERKK
jgi:hypothetical protein